MPLKQGLENPTNNSFTEATTRPTFPHMLVGLLVQGSRILSNKDPAMGMRQKPPCLGPAGEGRPPGSMFILAAFSVPEQNPE